MIKHGANVNTTCTSWENEKRTVTPIGCAASQAPNKIKYQLIEALLDAGAVPGGSDNAGQPVIVSACIEGPRIDSEYRHGDFLVLLLDAGADINYTDELGQTLIHHVAKANNYQS